MNRNGCHFGLRSGFYIINNQRFLCLQRFLSDTGEGSVVYCYDCFIRLPVKRGNGGIDDIFNLQSLFSQHSQRFRIYHIQISGELVFMLCKPS
jgi:hypothetical protein